jgi:PRC-barrel domain/Cysteine rich repeat
MATFSRTAVVSAAVLALAWGPAELAAQSTLKNRVAGAIDAVEGACASDIAKFCGNVSRGEGRVLLCMQAHDDQLSRRCQFTLFRVSRHLERAVNRVERIADACWDDIQAHCGNADKIGQCVMEKGPALSPACRTVVAGIKQTLQGLASLKGLPVYSSDNEDLGRVVKVVRGTDGKVQAVQVEVGRFLGVGERTMTIDAKSFEQLADRIRLRITGEGLRSLPESKKQ